MVTSVMISMSVLLFYASSHISVATASKSTSHGSTIVSKSTSHGSTIVSKSTSHGSATASISMSHDTTATQSKSRWENRDSAMSLLRSLKSDLKDIKSEVGAMQTSIEEKMAAVQETMQTKIEEGIAAGLKAIQTKVENVAAGEKAIQAKIENVSGQQRRVQSKMTAIEADVAYLQASVYTSYPGVFVGRGWEKYRNETTRFSNLDFAECMRKCYSKRKRDEEWDGVVYWSSYKYCMCNKNDSGHRNNTHYLHYRFT